MKIERQKGKVDGQNVDTIVIFTEESDKQKVYDVLTNANRLDDQGQTKFDGYPIVGIGQDVRKPIVYVHFDEERMSEGKMYCATGRVAKILMEAGIMI